MERILCSRKEAAAMLGCGLTKLNELLQSRQIDSVYIGSRRRLVVIASVKAYIAKLLRQARKKPDGDDKPESEED
jgi:excisionase family DNA binding protein